MIYSTSTKYAVMALIELAVRQDEQPVQVKKISDSTGIPRYFLAKLVQTLVKADILNSTKGRGGGLQFALSPSQVTIADVIKAIDGQRALQNCIFGLQSCNGDRNCSIHPMWGSIRAQIISFLANTTIADLAFKGSEDGRPEG